MSREQARNPQLWDNINSLLMSSNVHLSSALTDQIVKVVELMEEDSIMPADDMEHHIPEECPDSRCPICICVANYVFRRDVKSS